jgi:hypothetical protein
MEELEQAAMTTEAEAKEARESQAQTNTAQKEPACWSDIVLFCRATLAYDIAEAFEAEIKDAGEDLPMYVISVGQSRKLKAGMIVLEWQGPITQRFLHNLDIDPDILDYYIYTWTASADNQEHEETQTSNDEQIKDRVELLIEELPKREV